METAVALKEDVKRYELDWTYYGRMFLFENGGGINSKSTVSTYMSVINTFARYIEEQKVTAPTAYDALGFVGWLKERDRSPLTVEYYATVLRRYFAFLSEKKAYPNIFEGVEAKAKKSKGPTRNTLQDEELAKLRAYMKRQKGQRARRDRLVVELMAYNGLRCCEVARLRVEDLKQVGDKYLLYPHRKGRVKPDPNDVLFMLPELYRAIQAYLKKFGVKSGYIFRDVTHKSGTSHLTPCTISYTISDWMRRAGIKSRNCTPHSLRHRFATALVEAGVHIRKVQRAMGHSDLQSTLVYLHDSAYVKDPPELVLVY